MFQTVSMYISAGVCFLVTRSADYIVTDYIDFLSHWIILSTDLFNYTDSFRSESLNNSLNQPIQVFRWTGLQLQHPSDKDIWKWMDRFFLQDSFGSESLINHTPDLVRRLIQELVNTTVVCRSEMWWFCFALELFAGGAKK